MLNIIGILNPNAQPQAAQSIQSSKTLFAWEFYFQVLNPTLKQLPLDAETRQNNLVQTSETTGILPTFYMFYAIQPPRVNPSQPYHIPILHDVF